MYRLERAGTAICGNSGDSWRSEAGVRCEMGKPLSALAPGRSGWCTTGRSQCLGSRRTGERERRGQPRGVCDHNCLTDAVRRGRSPSGCCHSPKKPARPTGMETISGWPAFSAKFLAACRREGRACGSGRTHGVGIYSRCHVPSVWHQLARSARRGAKALSDYGGVGGLWSRTPFTLATENGVR